jgi:NADH:ubiquinone oxidoreductase subunit C
VALGGFQRLSLREDFPMRGCVEVRYDDERTRFVYESGEKAKPQPAMTNASRLI